MLLYSRNDCPLCEDVEQTLQRLMIDFKFIDIDLDESLRIKYHVKVPVLVNKKNHKNDQELNWPFDDKQLKEFAQC